MRTMCLATTALVVFCGCNSSQLRFTTLRLSATIPDVQERQVLDNLARIAADPGSLPYYTTINQGLANILDTGSGGLSALTLHHKVNPLATLTGTASRAVTGNWTINPTFNPDRLRAMRAAYYIALGIGPLDPRDQQKLDEILHAQPGLTVRRGWLCVGKKHDVPHGACHVAHDGKTYVWVMPEHSKDFADFTLLMLNIASYTAPAGPSKMSVDITSFPSLTIGKPLPGKWATPAPDLEIMTHPAGQPFAPSSPSSSFAPRLYEDSPLNRGLFFVPR